MKKNATHFLDDTFVGLTSVFSENRYSQVAVLVDENTLQYCYPMIGVFPSHHIIEIKSGEEQKNLDTASHIWEQLTGFEFDRHALLINLGGGVIGDMGGFCASTYKRGISFIQIPTTLLAMVDASAGGKLGIDFKGFKNHIGVFNEPQGVYINPGFLKTLDRRELRSGYAEVIKHCLIKDARKWNEIRETGLEQVNDVHYDWTTLISHSISIKREIVEEDPTEKGLRKILNFGHTLGHAIETLYLKKGDKKLLHGEAIAIGMIAESFLSYKKKFITSAELETISHYIISIFNKTVIEEADIEPIIINSVQDKKNSFGNVNFSLLTKLGSCGYDYTISKEEMRESIDFYINI